MSKERAAEPIIRGCRFAIRRGASVAVDLVGRLDEDRAKPMFQCKTLIEEGGRVVRVEQGKWKAVL